MIRHAADPRGHFATMTRLFDAAVRLKVCCAEVLERPGTQAALYNGAAVALLAAAAWLRFYDLGAPLLWLDEAVVAENTSGALADVLTNTATNSPSPILHPLLLHFVQNIDGSAAALRAASALGSVLAIAAMLFLLPRVGVARWAAFVAGLLALVSVEAVRQAQDAREYSIDVLLAVLTVVGCLAMLRERRWRLLCGALFIGPLLQYGLALLGIATLGTLLLAHATTKRGATFTGWLKQGSWLAAPGAAFAAGCGLTYALTLRHQGIASVQDETYGFVPLDHLYEGEPGDLAALAQFAAEQTWGFLAYHIPAPIAAVGLVAFVAAAALAGWRKGGRILPMLFALAIAVALAAAALRLYPFGGVRHTMYLSAIAFIALGCGFHAILAKLPALWRHAGAAGGAVAIAVVGGLALSNYSYAERGRAEALLATLRERVGDDPIYVPFNSAPVLRFYQRQHTGDYRFGPSCPLRDRDGCTDAVMAGLLPLHAEGKERVWAFSFVRDYVEGVIAGWWRAGEAQYAVGSGTLHGFLIDDLDTVLAGRLRILKAHDELQAGGLSLGPEFRAFWDSERRRVNYGKAPCRRIQTWGTFMLRVVPEDRAVLAPERRQFGADNLDFKFNDHGQRWSGNCMAVAGVPDYPIARIDAGQYNAGGRFLWAQSFNAGAGRAARQVLEAAPTPIIDADFAVHRHGRELAYVREGCEPEHIREPFFLRVTPANPAALPPAQREQGHAKLDFPFDLHGVQDFGRCLVARTLPDFEIAAIETGQGEPDAEPSWSGMARFR